MVKNPPTMQETQDKHIQSLGQEDPLERMATHSSILAWRIPWDSPVFLLGESHGQRSLDMTEAIEHAHMHVISNLIIFKIS